MTRNLFQVYSKPTSPVDRAYQRAELMRESSTFQTVLGSARVDLIKLDQNNRWDCRVCCQNIEFFVRNLHSDLAEKNSDAEKSVNPDLADIYNKIKEISDESSQAETQSNSFDYLNLFFLYLSTLTDPNSVIDDIKQVLDGSNTSYQSYQNSTNNRYLSGEEFDLLRDGHQVNTRVLHPALLEKLRASRNVIQSYLPDDFVDVTSGLYEDQDIPRQSEFPQKFRADTRSMLKRILQEVRRIQPEWLQQQKDLANLDDFPFSKKFRDDYNDLGINRDDLGNYCRSVLYGYDEASEFNDNVKAKLKSFFDETSSIGSLFSELCRTLMQNVNLNTYQQNELNDVQNTFRVLAEYGVLADVISKDQVKKEELKGIILGCIHNENMSQLDGSGSYGKIAEFISLLERNSLVDTSLIVEFCDLLKCNEFSQTRTAFSLKMEEISSSMNRAFSLKESYYLQYNLQEIFLGIVIENWKGDLAEFWNTSYGKDFYDSFFTEYCEGFEYHEDDEKWIGMTTYLSKRMFKAIGEKKDYSPFVGLVDAVLVGSLDDDGGLDVDRFNTGINEVFLINADLYDDRIGKSVSEFSKTELTQDSTSEQRFTIAVAKQLVSLDTKNCEEFELNQNNMNLIQSLWSNVSILESSDKTP